MASNAFTSKALYKIGKENDEKAFRKLFDQYYASLVHYSAYIIGSAPLAEEIVSEVFVLLWKSRQTLTNVKDIKRYLYTSTKNKTIDYIRRKKNLTFISVDKKNLREYVVYENPEDQCIEKEIRDRLEEAVLKLPEKCRMIFRMVKEEQMKYDEVAELLDISPKTVENQMVKALKVVRAEIVRYYQADEQVFRIVKSATKALILIGLSI